MEDLSETALRHYLEFLEKIDGFCRAADEALPGAMACRKGCDSCCRHLSLFPVEAVALRLSLDRVEDGVRERIREKAHEALDDPDGPCPLLDGSICLLYPARPIICRTHGYPILVDKGREKIIDHCPLNFIDGREIPRSHILDLETLNTALTAINRLFMDQVFGDPRAMDRLLMAEALLMDFDG
ncbi:hypothetical protein JCM14469_10530 [Desulfatiferula olefinivorans]